MGHAWLAGRRCDLGHLKPLPGLVLTHWRSPEHCGLHFPTSSHQRLGFCVKRLSAELSSFVDLQAFPELSVALHCCHAVAPPTVARVNRLECKLHAMKSLKPPGVANSTLLRLPRIVSSPPSGR